MSPIREIVFDWLFNAAVQIGLFAILAAALSPIFAKAKAKYQHWLYLAVFALCMAAPVFNTLWRSRPSVSVQRFQQQPMPGTEARDHRFWAWAWDCDLYRESVNELWLTSRPKGKGH